MPQSPDFAALFEEKRPPNAEPIPRASACSKASVPEKPLDNEIPKYSSPVTLSGTRQSPAWSPQKAGSSSPMAPFRLGIAHRAMFPKCQPSSARAVSFVKEPPVARALHVPEQALSKDT
ncbi:hypothetical protein PG999_012878 [Apiospora kogelbergensis]|uniref:Uncharacterized protein n=1 Tax=Apiospora kogelbergensis TaxID=1337665 RepID=A0AAW0QAX4_9PEZI